MDSASEMRLFQRKIIDKQVVEVLDELKKKGMEIYKLSPSERAEFKKAVEPVIESFKPIIGKELIESAQKMIM